jgi:hypothetical protein
MNASQFAGQFMLAQICLIAGGTLVSVCIMYLYSVAAFHQPVPNWLLAITCLSGHVKRNGKIAASEQLPLTPTKV